MTTYTFYFAGGLVWPV